MNAERTARIEELRRQGESERAALAADVAELHEEFSRRRAQWKFIGTALTVLATTGAVLYKLFGRASVAYRVGRIASAAGVLFQLGRAAFRTKKLW